MAAHLTVTKRAPAKSVLVPVVAVAVAATALCGQSPVDPEWQRAGAEFRWDARLLPNRKLRTIMLNSEKAIELEGTIMAVLPGTMFRVALANQHLVLAHISGKMRKRFIRLTIGDRVKIEMSPYDTAKARIVYRL